MTAPLAWRAISPFEGNETIAVLKFFPDRIHYEIPLFDKAWIKNGP